MKGGRSSLGCYQVLFRSLLFFGLISPCWSQPYQHQVGVSWNFTPASSPLGWSPIAALSNFGVQNGALTFTATSQITIVYSPAISVPTKPMQLVEVVMSSDTAGPAEVFWAPSPSVSNPQVGFTGFQGGDENDFTMVGDSALHHYYLPIDTSSAKTIYRLRMDVPPGATVSIQSVDVANLVAPSGSGVSPLWQFTSDSDSFGWIPYSGLVDMNVSGGSLQLQTFANATILAPNAQITNQLEWFSLFGRVTQTSLETPWIQFNFVSSAGGVGSDNVYFPITADSQDHVYSLDVGGIGGWYSTVSQLSITVSENTTVAISQMQVSAAPQGPADLAVDAFGPATPLVRAGSQFQISCRVSNRGAQSVQGLSVSLSLPSDGSVKMVSSPSIPASLTNGYPQTLVWTLIASGIGSIPISVSATSSSGSAQASATILVNPSVTAQSSPYVPLPVPVSSNYDIGIYYFPGWNLDSHWDPIRNFPERMPVLGYYAEGSPQVLDWQIKWAVEHGVKFFAVDWSWYGPRQASPAGEQPNNFLQAYFSSAYHSYVQFCLAYAGNSSGVIASSTADLLTITQAWINEYFSRPEYYRINQTPVILVLNPDILDANLGGSAKQALEAARQLAKSAGLNGIYFIAATGPAQVSQYLADGYDALSAYNYTSAGTSDPDESTYSAMVTGYASIWDPIIAASTVPYIIPTSPGFDLRPWATFDAPWEQVRTGSTADLFEQMLQAAKTRIDSGKAPRVVLVEAWNELGEGSYVEPTAGQGFSYLDAIRRVFVDTSPHTDLAPTDVGLPLVQALPSTALWTFTDPSDLLPWQVFPGPPFFDWTVNVSSSQITNNQWTFTSNGSADLVRMGFELSAQQYSGVAITMSVSGDTNVNVYWGADDEPGLGAIRNIGFTANAGPMQTYTLALAGQTGWRGYINLLSLMMSSSPNVNLAIQSIEFIPSSTATTIAVSKTQMQFRWTAGTATPTSQIVSLASATGSNLSWTATGGNASWLLLSPSNGAAPSNIVVSVNPVGLAVGVYNATITISSANAANSPLTIPVTLWVMPTAVTPPTPSITTVLNGADFKSEALSAGAWISIFGQNFGQSATATAANTFTLGGASVSVCGIAATLSYNSGPVTTNGSTTWQLNALMPAGVAGQTSCPVIVTVTNQSSQPASVAIASDVMELFLFTSSAGSLPIITHADYSLVGPATAGLVPAKPNETVIAWGTGDCSAPGVTVDGASATVTFSGQVEPGVCQVNFVVPNSPAGSNQLKLSTSPNLYALWVSP
jgi:uncharacterized protein (TIGR03437 family)